MLCCGTIAPHGKAFVGDLGVKKYQLRVQADLEDCFYDSSSYKLRLISGRQKNEIFKIKKVTNVTCFLLEVYSTNDQACRLCLVTLVSLLKQSPDWSIVDNH